MFLSKIFDFFKGTQPERKFEIESDSLKSVLRDILEIERVTNTNIISQEISINISSDAKALYTDGVLIYVGAIVANTTLPINDHFTFSLKIEDVKVLYNKLTSTSVEKILFHTMDGVPGEVSIGSEILKMDFNMSSFIARATQAILSNKGSIQFSLSKNTLLNIVTTSIDRNSTEMQRITFSGIENESYITIKYGENNYEQKIPINNKISSIFEVAFDSNKLKLILEILNDGDIQLNIQNAKSPVFFKSSNDHKSQIILMPLK